MIEWSIKELLLNVVGSSPSAGKDGKNKLQTVKVSYNKLQ